MLISGQGHDHHMWDPILEDFAAHYRAIVFDHRGTGESDKPAEPSGYTTRRFAGDVVALLEHLRIPRAHAYGLSMGGRICQWLAIDHMDRVGAVVLGCSTPGNAHGVRRSAEMEFMMANPSADPREALKLYLDPFVSPDWAKAHHEYVAAAEHRVRHPIPRFAQRFHYRASEAHDAWARLPAIMAPTLVIHGSDDRINPAGNAGLLAGRIPGAELHIVEGGRHGYFVEFREEASRVVLDFLRRHPLEASPR